MELRPELLPPDLDETQVSRLAAIASRLDGYNEYEETLAALLDEFNQDADTSLDIETFQGIYKGEDHNTWVCRVLVSQKVRPVPDITRAELVEIVRRAMPQNGDPRYEAYMEILDKNVPLPGASNLFFYPLDYDTATNTWGGGRQMGDYDPTPDQIVDWATRPIAKSGSNEV